MKSEPGTTALEVYLIFEDVSATVNHIKEAIAWCRATAGTKPSFTQAMDSRNNPLSDWSRGNRYQGLKTWSSDRYPPKEQIARKKCLAHWGYSCIVCGFSFEERYGALGHLYIHVHHLRELSKAPPDYHVNPIKDLVP